MSGLLAVSGVARDPTPRELLTFRFYGSCELPATETLLLRGLRLRPDHFPGLAAISIFGGILGHCQHELPLQQESRQT